MENVTLDLTQILAGGGAAGIIGFFFYLVFTRYTHLLEKMIEHMKDNGREVCSKLDEIKDQTLVNSTMIQNLQPNKRRVR